MNKKALSTQALFFFFMAAIFVYLLIFGFQKIFFVQEELSDQDRRELISKLEDAFSLCSDPLNKGNIQRIEVKNNKIGGVCILGNSPPDTIVEGIENSEFEELYSTGHNLVFLRKTQGYIIVDTSEIKDISVSKTSCSLNEEDKESFFIEIECF